MSGQRPSSRPTALAVSTLLLLVALLGACSNIADDRALEAPAEDDPNADATSPQPADEIGADDTDGAGTDARPAPADSGPGHLVDATADLGIDEALLGVRGHAVAAGDINGDGWIDLFVGTFADRPTESYEVRGADGPAPDRLLIGGPDGFSIDESFNPPFGRTAGAHFADLDNDDDLDLVVSRNVRDAPRADGPSEIYRNDGGTLVAASVLDDQRGGRAVGTVDVDGDGLLDIVLVEDRWAGASSAVFRNLGDLRFEDATAAVGIPPDVFGLGLGIGDLDDDGVDDLVFGGSNRIFLGGDGGRFTEATTSPLPWALAGDEDDPAHVVLADADHDGRLDILIGQHFNSTVDFERPEPIRLFLNDGAGGADVGFTDATAEADLPPLMTKSPQLVLLDLDADGYDDIITTASVPGTGAADSIPYVLLGAGDGAARFTPSGESAPGGPHYWIDAVVLDANNDGRDDVFFVEWEPSLGSRLFLNLPVGP